jgi:hypothetical protein
MSSTTKITQDRPERRSDADLDGQYRPIGIGAVAAAISAAGKRAEPAPGAANSNERTAEHESLAA